ncbi:pteridine reductase [Marinobacter vinifirmus]|uniref:Pteridine reductase n=1 Tax=Marinobacter vinifirmus TaxID=355591 RepID=A0A558BDX9_9GAMM|nr:pteridine reductase [Marinobacter vinifirmus]TVT34709.1 MAG: pteridine reductase [Marinobacter vinifirmus]
MAAPVVLITGAAHRLGAHTAETLHGRGWNVVIHYRSRQEQARQLIDKLNRERADSATSVQADLTNPEDLALLAKTACNHWQRLDGLVNNASVFYPNPTENATEDDWQGIMGANLKAPFFLLQHCLPALKKSSGAVVNLIDIYSEKPLKDHPLYCASKAGLAALTRSWAKDLAPAVRVNGVSPGAILWPEGEAEIDPDYQKAILDKTPLARTGNPADIAGAITWLMCDAPFVTGQVISVDGGRSLNM